jgi:hypothetical protein
LKREQQLVLNFYEQMLLCFEVLSEAKKKDLAEFEKKQPTSDWPGWKEYIRDQSA